MNEKEMCKEADSLNSEGSATVETQKVSAGEKGEDAKNVQIVPEESAGEQISALTTKVAELNDLYLRKAADFENFRKRMFKEKQEAIDFANLSLILDILPILDDFERALKAEDSAKTESDFQNLFNGIKMIGQRLGATLENKWGLKHFDSQDTVFDPARHEALTMEKSADVMEALVKEDFAKGYTLKDRVIRTAKVKVLMPLDG